MKKWASTNINGLFHHGWSSILLAALLVALAMAYAPVARAAGVVSSCDEASLLTAVSGGGRVTFTCSGTITLTATITIPADTTIDGTGQNVTISGGNAGHVLSVLSGIQLNLNKLTIAQGRYGYGYSFGDGAGIFNQGTLTVTNSTFSGNTSFFYGGGIANFGTLTVTNSTFEANSASYGGGIANFGTLTVTNSTFFNVAQIGGGGIYNYYLATLTVANSTFRGNYATYYGGGIFNELGTLIVTNSTFEANSASYGGGGGIFNQGTLTVTNSTFSGNLGFFYGGGSIFNDGTLTLRNTIVANSFRGNCASFGSSLVGDGGGNLDTDGTCVGTISPDPLLGLLQNNGGPTQTMAISMASPTFAGANPANCPATDQRGVLRPQFMACDIGAYEFDTANSLLTAVRNNILTLIPTGNQHDQTTLTAVASALAAALNSHNWRGTDGNHLNPSEGEDVFELLVEKVSAPLTQLLKASPPSAIPAQTLQTLLNNVTLAGRTLATVAISDAAGGDPTKLARSKAFLAKGDTDAAAGKYVSALVDYEFAWALL